MPTNLEIIRSTYEGSAEDNGHRLLDAMAPDVAWTEAEGFPYAGTYVGPQAVFDHVFRRLATEWVDYRAAAEHYVVDGEQVVAFGTYSGTYKATGRAMRAAFAHHWTLRGGQIVRMVQYVDSYLVRQAMLDGEPAGR